MNNQKNPLANRIAYQNESSSFKREERPKQ